MTYSPIGVRAAARRRAASLPQRGRPGWPPDWRWSHQPVSAVASSPCRSPSEARCAWRNAAFPGLASRSQISQRATRRLRARTSTVYRSGSATYSRGAARPTPAEVNSAGRPPAAAFGPLKVELALQASDIHIMQSVRRSSDAARRHDGAEHERDDGITIATGRWKARRASRPSWGRGPPGIVRGAAPGAGSVRVRVRVRCGRGRGRGFATAVRVRASPRRVRVRVPAGAGATSGACRRAAPRAAHRAPPWRSRTARQRLRSTRSTHARVRRDLDIGSALAGGCGSSLTCFNITSCVPLRRRAAGDEHRVGPQRVGRGRCVHPPRRGSVGAWYSGVRAWRRTA